MMDTTDDIQQHPNVEISVKFFTLRQRDAAERGI